MKKIVLLYMIFYLAYTVRGKGGSGGAGGHGGSHGGGGRGSGGGGGGGSGGGGGGNSAGRGGNAARAASVTAVGALTGMQLGLIMGAMSNTNSYYASSPHYMPGPTPGTPPSAEPPPTAKPIPLSIFYDAMDMDSQIFFNTSFNREYPKFATFFDVSLIPCQKAEEKNGDISCPGKADPACKLNKVNSCAIVKVTDKVQLAGYLGCTMSNVEKLPDFGACATQAKVDDKQIQSCADSDEGKNLCKDFIKREAPGDQNFIPRFIFKPPDDIKPAYVFERFDLYISDACATDFALAMCSQLKAANMASVPPVCNQKLLLGIFYKAMDDKSQKWIQLFGTLYDRYKDFVIPKFVPCMFAEFVGDKQLDCKDPNDPECVAGKTHACAVKLIQDRNALFQFIKCSTQDSTKIPNFEKCAKDNQIDYHVIKSCADSDEGKNLCHDFSKFRPESERIPNFSYELMFNDKMSEVTAMASDLKAVFCQLFEGFAKLLPPDCTAPPPAPPIVPPLIIPSSPKPT